LRWIGRDEQRVDPRHRAVHLGHDQLGLEVGHHPQALDDEVGPHVTGEVDHQAREHRDPDVVEVCHRLRDHGLAVLELEQRLALLGVAHRGDDDVVEQPRRHLDDAEMPVVDRIERAGIEDGGHEVRLLVTSKRRAALRLGQR
jgi:hypothetical protein